MKGQDGSLVSPSAPPAPPLDPATPATAAVATLLRDLLGVVVARLPRLLRDPGGEPLHDVRVALRRARSLLRELRAGLPAERTEPLRDGLSHLADLTGPLRDLDVLEAALPDYIESLPAAVRAHAEPLAAALAEDRRRRLREVVAALDTPPARSVLEEWRALAQELAEAPGPPAREVAERRLRKIGWRVGKQAATTTRQSSAADLHRLRIEAKRLRYLLEFFRSFYDPEPVASLLRPLRRLQERLGELQDLSVHAARLATLQPADETGWPPATWVAVGRLLAELERRSERRRRKIDKVVRRFARDEPERLANLLASAPAGERP